jgi:hypothetical protein
MPLDLHHKDLIEGVLYTIGIPENPLGTIAYLIKYAKHFRMKI